MTLITCVRNKDIVRITADRTCVWWSSYIKSRNKIIDFMYSWNRIVFAFSWKYVDHDIIQTFIRNYLVEYTTICDTNIYHFNDALVTEYSKSIEDFTIHYIIAIWDVIYSQTWWNIWRIKDGDPMLALWSWSSYAKWIYEYAIACWELSPYKLMYEVINKNIDPEISSEFNTLILDLKNPTHENKNQQDTSQKN